MRKFSLLIVIAVVLSLYFTSCGPKDTTPPKIYILGVDGIIVGNHDNPYDTTVLMYVTYIEPTKDLGDFTFTGVQVEDNASRHQNIIVESDIASLRTTASGYLRRQGTETITYTAKDEEGNERTAQRNLIIRNISNAFVGTYETSRSTLFLDNTFTYNSNVAADITVPGRLRFPRVYYKIDEQGNQIFYRVNADLWSNTISTSFSTSIAYMGISNADRDTPFFADMTYDQAIDTIRTFTRLRIDEQFWTDTLGNQVRIMGLRDPENDSPLSRIEYVGDSKTIARIVLRINVTNTATNQSDNVTEIYTPF